MHRPLYSIPLLSLSVLTGCTGNSRPDELELRDGDLLFQLNTDGSHITDVTTGIDALPIEHVGIYIASSKFLSDGVGDDIVMPCVLEAIPDSGVTLTALDVFLSRAVSSDDMPLVLVGRVTSAKFDVEMSLNNACRYIGTPYDSLYMPDDREIYCSELVQKSYVDRLGHHLFSPIPMSFRDASGEITEHWESFYTRLGLVVPDGEPGSNPGELSRRENVDIVGRMF